MTPLTVNSDSNETFWQIFTNVKISKTKILGFEELEMLFRFAEEIMLLFVKVNLHLYLVKTNIKYYFYLVQQYTCVNKCLSGC